MPRWQLPRGRLSQIPSMPTRFNPPIKQPLARENTQMDQLHKKSGNQTTMRTRTHLSRKKGKKKKVEGSFLSCDTLAPLPLALAARRRKKERKHPGCVFRSRLSPRPTLQLLLLFPLRARGACAAPGLVLVKVEQNARRQAECVLE